MTRVADTSTERWVTLGEAVKLLGKSRPTLYRYVKLTKATVRQHPLDKRCKYIDINELKRHLRK